MAKCLFLYFVLKSSQSIPSCFLALFEIGRSDLVDPLDKICTGDHKVFDNGALQYTIKYLNKSFPFLLSL